MEKALWLMPLVLILIPTNAIRAQDETSEAVSAQQLKEWVTKLESESYAARSVATERLILAGRNAIEPVTAAVETGGLETVIRGVYVLRQLAINAESPQVQTLAYDALERLANRRVTTAARRASAAMMAINETRQRQAQARLEQLGAVITMTQVRVGARINHPFPAIHFGESWRGTAEDLVHLRWLTNYMPNETAKWMIAMEGERVTDAWMRAVAPLENVAVVHLKSTSVSDDGIARLRDMPDLQYVELRYLPITDASLPHIKAIQSLQRVEVFGTKVSAEAAAQLQAELVNVEVDYRRGGFLGIGCDDDPCRVTQVRELTAASRAGIQMGDIITHFNGKPVNTMDELTQLIAQNAAGETVSVSFRRGAEKFEREVKLGSWE